MKVLPKGKQVRFAQLVKAAGRPRAATLWVGKAEEDPDFKSAMAENRIVTVRGSNVGTKKDRGVVGFLTGGNATYLIFPKALPMAEGTGVIGLKFEELADTPVKDPVKVKEARRSSKVEKVRTVREAREKKTGIKDEKKPAEVQEGRFAVMVEFTARVEREFEVRGGTAAAAIDKALREAEKGGPGKVKWGVEAVEARKVS